MRVLTLNFLDTKQALMKILKLKENALRSMVNNSVLQTCGVY